MADSEPSHPSLILGPLACPTVVSWRCHALVSAAAATNGLIRGRITLSVVVPCYNEEAVIYRRRSAALKSDCSHYKAGGTLRVLGELQFLLPFHQTGTFPLN